VTGNDYNDYMNTACTLNVTAQLAASNNVRAPPLRLLLTRQLPAIEGEWWIATGFQATASQLRNFGDAQKLRWKQVGLGAWYCASSTTRRLG